MVWEIIARMENGDGDEVVLWRARDSEGRIVYGVSRSQYGTATEPVGPVYYSRRTALQNVPNPA